MLGGVLAAHDVEAAAEEAVVEMGENKAEGSGARAESGTFTLAQVSLGSMDCMPNEGMPSCSGNSAEQAGNDLSLGSMKSWTPCTCAMWVFRTRGEKMGLCWQPVWPQDSS